jgi:uncharacterized protein (UPF0276 family)
MALPRLGFGLGGDDAALERALAEAPGRELVELVEAHEPPPVGAPPDRLADEPFAADPDGACARSFARAPRAGRPLVAHLDSLDDAAAAHRAIDLLARRRGAAWISVDGLRAPAGLPGDFAVEPLTEAACARFAARLAAARAAAPVPLVASLPLAELPIGELHPCEALARIAADTGAPLRLDLTALVAWQAARGHAPDHRIGALPFERVEVLALSTGELQHARGVAFLDESVPALCSEVLHLLAQIAPRCALAAVILRAGRDADETGAAIDAARRAAGDALPRRA